MTILMVYLAAKRGDSCALEALVTRFHPLMVKMSVRRGYFDEDCYQECAMAMVRAVHQFEIKE